MKKIIISAFALFAFVTTNLQADVSGFGFGLTITNNTVDGAYVEDGDSDGSTETSTSSSDDITGAAIFAENTVSNGRGGITFGVSLIPFDMELSKKSVTQSAVGNASDGAATSGTNSAEGKIQLHTTAYIQPGVVTEDGMTMVYGTIGMIQTRVEATSKNVSSENFTETKTIDGSVYGVGIKRATDNGMFFKLDYTQSDYDKMTFVTENNTTVTADLDNEQIAFSIGKSF
jgi:hypothetical protein